MAAGLHRTNPLHIHTLVAENYEKVLGEITTLEKHLKSHKARSDGSPPPASRATQACYRSIILVNYAYPRDNNPSYSVKFTIERGIQFTAAITQLYKAWSCGLPSKGPRQLHYEFQIPQTTICDFKQATYETPDGMCTPLTQEQANTLKEEIDQIAHEIGMPLRCCSDEVALLSNPIEGSTFDVFVRSPAYHRLAKQQKEHLFITLGKIAFTDLIIGNNLRIFQTTGVCEHMLELKTRADLNNIVVAWTPSDKSKLPELYAINHTMLGNLFDGEEYQTDYCSLLGRLCGQPNMAHELGTVIIKSLKNTFFTEDPKQLTMLAPFHEDLENISIYDAVSFGIHSMAERVRTEYIPRWTAEGEDAPSIKRYLNDTCPKLLQIVSKHLDVFESVYTSPETPTAPTSGLRQRRSIRYEE